MASLHEGSFGFQIKKYDPTTPSNARRIPAEVWAVHKEVIFEWHAQRVTRSEILRKLQADRHFSPSRDQLNSKMTEWGLSVYAKRPKQTATTAVVRSPLVARNDQQAYPELKAISARVLIAASSAGVSHEPEQQPHFDEALLADLDASTEEKQSLVFDTRDDYLSVLERVKNNGTDALSDTDMIALKDIQWICSAMCVCLRQFCGHYKCSFSSYDPVDRFLKDLPLAIFADLHLCASTSTFPYAGLVANLESTFIEQDAEWTRQLFDDLGCSTHDILDSVIAILQAVFIHNNSTAHYRSEVFPLPGFWAAYIPIACMAIRELRCTTLYLSNDTFEPRLDLCPSPIREYRRHQDVLKQVCHSLRQKKDNWNQFVSTALSNPSIPCCRLFNLPVVAKEIPGAVRMSTETTSFLHDDEWLPDAAFSELVREAETAMHASRQAPLPQSLEFNAADLKGPLFNPPRSVASSGMSSFLATAKRAKIKTKHTNMYTTISTCSVRTSSTNES